MKFNKKTLLALFVLFIVAFSVSAVSAEDVAVDDVADVAIDSTENVAAPVAVTTHQVADGANASTIQKIIDDANASDVISFAENGKYSLAANETININKTLTLIGNNATITCAFNGFLVAASKTTSIDGTSIDGFNFNCTSTKWGGKTDSNAEIKVNGGQNITIKNCRFLGMPDVALYLNGCTGNITVLNNYFTGTANASTISNTGKGETGTKAINVMGGNGILIQNNTVEGNVLDGFSVASNTQNVIMNNNTIDGAYYGVFYGGGLTNITTSNNKFLNIQTVGVSLMKAAQDSTIVNNTFVMAPLVGTGYTASVAVYIVQGDTAHGAATKIGNDLIQNNTFAKTGTNTTYAVEIVSANGPLKLNGPFKMNNNTFGDGVTPFIFIDETWNFNDGELDIPAYSMDSKITPEAEETDLTKDSTELIQLTAGDGTILPNQNVTLTIVGNNLTETRTLTTNKFGIVELKNNLTEGKYTVTANFAGATYNGGIYEAATATFTVNSIAPTEPAIPIITGTELKKYFKNESQYWVTLTAPDGTPLANEKVLIFINGRPYEKITGANGTAKLNINLPPGTYTLHAAFLGNDKYVSAIVENTVTVLNPIVAKDINMTTANRTAFTATILDAQGKPVIGANVTININGVIYKKTSDDSGVVSLNIRLPAGEYIATVGYPLVYDNTTTLESAFIVTIKP